MKQISLLLMVLCVLMGIVAGQTPKISDCDVEAAVEPNDQQNEIVPGCCVCPETGHIGLIVPTSPDEFTTPAAQDQLGETLLKECRHHGAMVNKICPVCPRANIGALSCERSDAMTDDLTPGPIEPSPESNQDENGDIEQPPSGNSLRTCCFSNQQLESLRTRSARHWHRYRYHYQGLAMFNCGLLVGGMAWLLVYAHEHGRI